MKFGLMLDLGRTDETTSFEQVLEQLTELVVLADQGGFDYVFVGEHHGHEMTIAPAPFTLLTHLASVTERVRLGTAVLCAPYWHPIRLAGEAALFDHISGGRLELGIGRGAYPYEFARMAGGIPPEVAREQLAELLPALRGLWQGNHTHNGGVWQFPETTSTPRPRDPKAGLPLWVSARHPEVFDLAVRNRANVMVAPLSKGMEEVVSLKERLDTAVASVDNGFVPQMMVLRDTCVTEGDAEPLEAVEHYRRGSGYFQNLFRTDGDVVDGFVQWIDPKSSGAADEYDDAQVLENQVFGPVESVVEKLNTYRDAGTDVYLYSASWGLPFEVEKKSLERFTREVIPAFRGLNTDD